MQSRLLIASESQAFDGAAPHGLACTSQRFSRGRAKCSYLGRHMVTVFLITELSRLAIMVQAERN